MKVGTVKVIASVFKSDGMRAGVILAIQRKKYWHWLPFGYYFQLAFSAKNGNSPTFLGWHEGTDKGEKALKEEIKRHFPGSKLVGASEMNGIDVVLDHMENLMANSR